jgi:Kef-type K+ transport system membrane component KefB
MNHTTKTLAIVAVIAIAALLLLGAIAVSSTPITVYAWKNKKKNNDDDKINALISHDFFLL